MHTLTLRAVDAPVADDIVVTLRDRERKQVVRSDRRHARPVLLVVAQGTAVSERLGPVAGGAGFDLVSCATRSATLRALVGKAVDLVLLDLRDLGEAGLDLLSEIRATAPATDVVALDAPDDREATLRAMQCGARDYFGEPLNVQRLQQLLVQLRRDRHRRANTVALHGAIAQRLEFHGLIGRSPAMEDVFSRIQRLAPHATVLSIIGERGTGKTLAARAFHRVSPLRDHPFVEVDAAAAVSTCDERLLEGSGTIFFENVSGLSLNAQAGLLRMLQRRDAHARSGDSRGTQITVIAANPRNLADEAASERLLGDLVRRLRQVEITLPPLRDRREDIPYLTAAFVRGADQRMGRPWTSLTPAAERMLRDARWNGNVRELKAVLEHACLLAHGGTISDRDLQVGPVGGPSRPAWNDPRAEGAPARTESVAALNDVERDHILDVLAQVRWNRTAAARLLGISRRALHRRIERYSGADALVAGTGSHRLEGGSLD